MQEPPKIIKKDVAIVGGGITGLSAAHRLVELSEGRVPDMILLESQNHLGGIISTSTYLDAFVEHGPDSFIVQKPWALDLCKRLGLENHILPTNNLNRRTLIAHDGKLHPLPEGFVMLAPTQFWPFLTSPLFSLSGKLRMAMDLFLPKGKNSRQESLSAFVRRRLGKEALERIAQPMVGGIYTADPEKLSLQAAMPRFIELEEKYGSIILGLWQESKKSTQDKNTQGARYSMFVTLDEGLELLVNNICERLPPGTISLSTKASRIEKNGNGYRIHIKDDSGEPKAIDASAVIICTQAYQTARIMETLDQELASDLARIPYASSCVLNLFYKNEKIPKLPKGFGFVVPTIEEASILACTISGAKFRNRAPEGMSALRVFLGGACHQGIFDLTDEKLVALAKKDLRRYLNIESEPESFYLTRHPRSMPQYHLGHEDLILQIETKLARHTGLAFAGNYFKGVGIPDCILSGELASKRILDVVKTC